MKILADGTLPGLFELFPSPFSLTLYQNQEQVVDLLPGHDILLCRSTLSVNAQLLTNSNIQCVATASSGTDHIDSVYLAQNNIALIDAKGSNARAVTDYVVASIAALHSIGKSTGKLAGIIGVGEVGSRVFKRLQAAEFDVICFDPIKALQDNSHPYVAFNDLTTCDVICIHANLHETLPYPSSKLINADFISQLKPGVVIINAARGGIVDEKALLAATNPITYCTDVYLGEPAINLDLIAFATLCTPHIAGHSIEAKNAAVANLSQKIHLKYGFSKPTFLASEKVPLPHGRGSDKLSWQEHVLNVYNPLLETYSLKSASDKKTAFLTQRQAHKSRHDFNVYQSQGINQQTQLILDSASDCESK